MQSEAAFQAQIIELAKVAGDWLIYHTYDSRRSVEGFPDLVLVDEALDRVYYRELKAARNRRPRADQLRWLESLTRAGQDAATWYPDDWDEQIVPLLTRGRGNGR